MLQKLRDRTQTLPFKIIAGAIIFVLCVFGFGAFNFFVSPDPAVATVNGEDIPQSKLSSETDRRRRTLLAQMGDNADPDLIDPVALQGSVLDQLVNQTLFEQASRDVGVQVSTGQVDRMITSTPEFQIAGRYDENTYRMLLRSAGFTPVGYRARTEMALTTNQLQRGFTDTSVLFGWERAQAAALTAQKRDVAYLQVDRALVEDELSVSDEEIAAYYEANEPDFMTAESVAVEYVELKLTDLEKDPANEPDEEALRARYAASKADFAAEERRRAAHILVQVNDERDEAEALAIVAAAQARLAAGEDFADLATELSEDPGSKTQGGDLGFASKGVYVSEFEEALFELAQGEVSEAVVTEFGVHLIRLEAIEQTTYPEFDEQRAALAIELRRAKAAEQFREKVALLDNLAFDTPDSLDAISSELGLTKKTAVGVTRTAGADVFGSEALRAALFTREVLDEGFNSTAIATADGISVVARVTEVTPAALRPLADVRDDIREQLLDDAATLRVEELVADAVTKLREGAATDDIASAAGATWKRAEAIRRDDTDTPREVVAAAFALSRPPADGRSVDSVTLAAGGQAAVVVTAVYDGDVAALPETEVSMIERQMQQRSGNLEFEGFYESVRGEASIRRRI